MSADDRRARVPLAGRRVDLTQLSAEVGVALCASKTELVVADPDSPVTVAQLTAALAAHVPATVAPSRDVALREGLTAASTLPALRSALLQWVGPAT